MSEVPVPSTRKRFSRRWALVLFFPVFFTVIAIVFPVREWMTLGLAWMDAQGPLAALYYVAFYAFAVVFVLPDLVINAAAGVLFGVPLGTLYASVGRVAGAAITFVVVRKLMHGWMARRMADDAQFAAIENAIARRGFRFVLLLRLCPIIPVNLTNMALGLTKISLPAYLAATFLGLIPRTFVVAYFGAGGRSIADIWAGAEAPTGMAALVFWGGFAGTVVLTVLLTQQARKFLREAMAEA